MSATTTTTPPRHTLVQQRDARGRLSSLHAALPVDGGWRTACGADLQATDRTPITTWDVQTGMTVLAARDARPCRRCDRVGDAIADEL